MKPSSKPRPDGGSCLRRGGRATIVASMRTVPPPSSLGDIEIVPLYRSGAGDIWTLIHDRRGTRTVVRHVPNAASGGQASDTAVAEFVAVRPAGPEHRAAQDWVLRSGARVPGL
jgi:hypothetical protein